MALKVWLDDVRTPPEGWVWARSGLEFQRFIRNEDVEAVSFDNDLGLFEPQGWELMKWMFREFKFGRARLPRILRVHSMNPVASKRMVQMIEDYARICILGEEEL